MIGFSPGTVISQQEFIFSIILNKEKYEIIKIRKIFLTKVKKETDDQKIFKSLNLRSRSQFKVQSQAKNYFVN